MKNRIVEREKRIIFSKLKPQWFLHKYIYDNNKNINMFIKESLILKKIEKHIDIKRKYKEEMKGVHDNASTFIHLNIKI